MNISKVTHQVKLDRWTAILKEQNSSGLSIKDWCSQNGITRDQFFYWKRKLKESVLESAPPISNHHKRSKMCVNYSPITIIESPR